MYFGLVDNVTPKWYIKYFYLFCVSYLGLSPKKDPQKFRDGHRIPLYPHVVPHVKPYQLTKISNDSCTLCNLQNFFHKHSCLIYTREKFAQHLAHRANLL
jgi:hypothetical protein